jgi:S1-C subfamily serine protease
MNASIKLLEAVLPAVVSLSAEVRETHPSAGILGTERHGTGVLIESTDLVLTVNYIVIGTDRIRAQLVDGTEIDGAVVARDFRSGIAVVRLASPVQRGLRARASADLRIGEDVAVIAAAAENARRASDGVTTSFARFDANWEYALERSIMTTARNPGFGGAPLIDVHGRVAGLVALDLGEIGRSTLAIPLENYLDHKAELLRSGRVAHQPRAWVGVICYVIRNHVVVAGVLPGSPADRSGLKAGDVVLAVDGHEVSERSELYKIVWSTPPGAVLIFRVFRNDSVRQISIAAEDAEMFFA